MVDKMAKLTISIENLAHFQCPHCKGWWSIGDAPEREYWFCPWCGTKCFTGGEVIIPVTVTGTGYIAEVRERPDLVIGDQENG